MNGVTETSKHPVGIVGVGRMGLAFAKHLMRHGYPTVVTDLSSDAVEAARAAGSDVAKTPAELATKTDFVIVVVGYDEEASAVIFGPHGLLDTMRPGSVIAVSSTCTPEHVKMLAKKAEAKGVALLDAPICRGQQAADAGTMLTLCGGKPEIFERAKPIYGTFSSDVEHLGDVGAGQFGKALNNFLLWVNGIALIEAGRLSEANGMDLVKLRTALLKSSGASDALKNWENVSFIWALKDMQIVSKIADSSGLSMPIAGAIKELVKDGLRIKRSNPPDWTGKKRV